MNPNVRSTRVEEEGKRYRLVELITPEGLWLAWPGGATFVSKRHRVVEALETDPAVRAPMTGRILQVSVQPGQHVEEEDLLIVMEAMKMEYRLRAPRSGEIEQVLCNEGDLVELGAELVVLSA